MTYNNVLTHKEEKIAVDLLDCALSWEPGARLLGNITAEELSYLAAKIITICPVCGTKDWTNTDCYLCNKCTNIIEKHNR